MPETCMQCCGRTLCQAQKHADDEKLGSVVYRCIPWQDIGQSCMLHALPLGWHGACPQGRLQLCIWIAGDAESRYNKNKKRTRRAHGDAAPAEQQEREPALGANADDDHVAGQLRHKVAHEEEPGPQPIQEVGQPNVLQPAKQTCNWGTSQLPFKHLELTKWRPVPLCHLLFHCRPLFDLRKSANLLSEALASTENSERGGKQRHSAQLALRGSAPCSERGRQMTGRRGPGTSAAPSRRGRGPGGSPCAAPRARRPPAAGRCSVVHAWRGLKLGCQPHSAQPATPSAVSDSTQKPSEGHSVNGSWQRCAHVHWQCTCRIAALYHWLWESAQVGFQGA